MVDDLPDAEDVTAANFGRTVKKRRKQERRSPKQSLCFHAATRADSKRIFAESRNLVQPGNTVQLKIRIASSVDPQRRKKAESGCCGQSARWFVATFERHLAHAMMVAIFHASC